MLGCMRRAFDLLADHKGPRLTLSSEDMQKDDPKVFEMISRADTTCVSQIESRAQMSMPPRLRTKDFFDIVIQSAILRLGTIQCFTLPPQFRRRYGKKAAAIPYDV